MLDDLFMQVLDMTKTASIVILVVLIARILLKRAPKWISYALWAVVLLRLLCPISIEAPVSVIPRMEPVSSDYSLADAPVSVVGATEAAGRAVGDVLNGGLGVQHIRTTETTENGSARYATSQWWEVWVLFGQYVWLVGIAVMLVYSVIAYIRLRRKLVGAMLLRENIYLADHIASPFVIGLVRPRIYLPSALGESEQEYIILHERHHIRRLDHVIKALAFLALCVHWFNPLVWLAFVLAGKDMEMSCDEAVIKKLGADIRADYSASLLSLATGRRVIAGTPLAFGEGDTGGRIKNLAKWKKPVIWIVVIAVLLCAVLAVCLLTDPLSESDTLELTERDTTGDFAVTYELDIGESVKSGRITAELWQKGECVQSAPVVFTRFAKEIEIRMTPRREEEKYTGVDVLIDTDQYGGSLLTHFALPEYSGGLGWSMTAYGKGDKQKLQPGEAKVLAAMSFDFGSGVRSVDCETLESEPARLKEAECMIVILAGFDAEELAPQATDEAVSTTKEVLQLHHVIKLAEKKYELNWADFEDFDYQETGSGLYIRHYPIDDTFSLWIGGSGRPEVESRPYYIYLSTGDLDTRIDIRDGGVEEFIAEHSELGENSVVDAAIGRMVNIRAEDMHHISRYSTIDAEQLAEAMNNAVPHRIEETEMPLSGIWSVDVYLTASYSSWSEYFYLSAGLEENIVKVRYHDGEGHSYTFFFEDEELYLIIKNSYTREGLIETEKLDKYSDIITARAEENIRKNEQAYGQHPFTGYEITEFYEHDRFEDGNEQYTVYKWDVAFTVDDPVKVGWAGGMWLDSELRVRAYEQCTYFVVRSVDGVMRDCEFLFWDLYNGAGDESEREYAWSEIQRTWRKLEMEAFINAMPNNGFVSSFYENVWEADLSQLIYQCVDESVTYESVREAYKAEVGDVHTDLSYISRDNLNKLLLSLTGYGLDDKEWNFGGTRYLASIDVYCVMHGDTNYDPFVCTGIDTDSELFTAVLRRKLADELSGEYLRVTLRDTGSGTYQFVSCQPLP